MNNRVKKPRSILALLIVTVMILTMGIPLQTVFAQASLSDIDGHWANKVISAWVDEGLVSGYPDGTFKPGSSITRAEFTVLVNKLFKFSETAPITFKDVNEKDWFYSDIAKAVKAGYIKGFEDGTVKPGNKISRQEVATIIASLEKLQASAADADSFKDAAKMPAWSKGWIGAVAKAKFMNGFPDGTFGFAKNLTRAEAVVALNNLRGIKVDSIADQTIKVDATSKVAVKVSPADAALSVKSSDEAVVKAAIVGSDVEIKGVKAGTATVTVTAKKGALPDGTATFKVTVEANVFFGGGGGGGVTPPPVQTDATANITVDVSPIPSIVNITVNSSTVGSKFKAEGTDPASFGTAVQVYVNNTTTKNVYILDANGNVIGTISVNVTADSRKDYTFKVQTVDVTNAVANITVDVSPVPSIVNVTVNSSTAGSKFKVEGTDASSFGTPVQVYVNSTTTTKSVYILDASGNTIGTITVNVKADSTKDYTFKVQTVDVTSATANITVDVSPIPSIVNVTVNSSTAGSKFKAEGTDPASFGAPVQVFVNSTTTTKLVYILDAAGNTIGTVTVNVKADSTKDYTFQVSGAANTKPVISVVEPDGTQDGLITLEQGAAFVKPAVSASDAEDGNITTTIVKSGESSVNTSIPGNYVLTYNVTDSKGLAADERRVTVRVVAPVPVERKANITVNVFEDLPTLVDITVNTSTVGTQFRIQNNTIAMAIGSLNTTMVEGDTLTVTLLNASGTVVGTVVVDKTVDSTRDYEVLAPAA